MWTGTPDIDVVAPVAPENVSGIPGANFNLVTWTDVDGEEEEMYDVFASENPITELGVPGVELIASNVLEGAQTATHYLFYPLEDASVTYYYAVVAVDAAGNVGEPARRGRKRQGQRRADPDRIVGPVDGDLAGLLRHGGWAGGFLAGNRIRHARGQERLPGGHISHRAGVLRHGRL